MYPSHPPSAPRWLQTCVRGCTDGDRVCLAGSWRDSISTFLRCRSRFERTWSAILNTSSSVQSTLFFFFFLLASDVRTLFDNVFLWLTNSSLYWGVSWTVILNGNVALYLLCSSDISILSFRLLSWREMCLAFYSTLGIMSHVPGRVVSPVCLDEITWGNPML